ncbi:MULTISPECIES: glycosyltransferase family 2 protein [Empedobacter]|uniref:Glycosyltransferase family 2 protein n=2 Tax=Empedobacter TaxID=59734 RepID=A0A7H9DPG6_9FLAO|nr:MULTISPECIES: glycosyltransferase family 2 protein [Empedobacter]QLL56895.1 glycosyltransferase family 2 protein [Empedobacter falsenii]
MFDLSIIIANYNNGHFFNDCYKSLINQTHKDFEVIIIDDCSTDNSIQVIEELVKGDSRFKLYKNEINLGYQKTLIKAIDLCTTNLFGRLDPDDALINTAIEKSIDAHIKNPSCGLVYSNTIHCDHMLKPLEVIKGKQITDLIFLNGEISHFATFKKKYYLETDGIDIHNKRAEDQDIYMKMCEVSQVFYLDEDLYLYRIHNNGASTNKNRNKALFWYWVAIIKAAERRNINVEDDFISNYVRMYKYQDLYNKYNKLLNNRWIKLGFKLGLIKKYK